MNRALALVLVLAAAPAALAQSVELTGLKGGPVTLTPQSLSALPMQQQEIVFHSSKGPEASRYKGVLLWDILSAHRAFTDDHKAALGHTLLVTAADGHQVAFSFGEMAPDFGNTPVMLAVERDGEPMANGLRIVLPGDKRGARNIRDVRTIAWR